MWCFFEYSLCASAIASKDYSCRMLYWSIFFLSCSRNMLAWRFISMSFSTWLPSLQPTSPEAGSQSDSWAPKALTWDFWMKSLHWTEGQETSHQNDFFCEIRAQEPGHIYCISFSCSGTQSPTYFSVFHRANFCLSSFCPTQKKSHWSVVRLPRYRLQYHVVLDLNLKNYGLIFIYRLRDLQSCCFFLLWDFYSWLLDLENASCFTYFQFNQENDRVSL